MTPVVTEPGRDRAAADVVRIRELAEGALRRFGLEGARAELLVHTVASTFRVDAPRGTFSLRLVRARECDHERLRSEQIWLESLRRDAGLVVPEPVPVADGGWIVEAGEDAAGEPRLAALFRWVEGSFLSDDLTPRLYGRVGEFMARLHRHGEGFEAPPGFSRPRYDLDGFAERVPEPFGDGLVGPRHRLLLREAAGRIEEHAAALGRGPEVYGLIHSDLQQRNFLFRDGRVRAIDFADGGWGHHLYDVAASVVRLTDRDDYPALRDAFLEGYAGVRPLPGDPGEYLESFLAARGVFVVSWVAGHWDNPEIRRYGREIVPYILGQVQRYLERRPGESGRGGGLSTLSTVAFLRHLQERDVELTARGDKLGFNAPKGALTPDLKAQLKVRKPELLAFLHQAATATGAGAPPIEPVDRGGELPLSFPQQRLWFFDQLEPGSAAYNIPPAVALEGEVSGPVLAQCFGEIVRRHEVLRTTFPSRDGRPGQRISPPELPGALGWAPPLVDLTGLTAGDGEGEADRLTREEARRPFDLSRGPLIRLRLLRRSGHDHRLLFTLHHIVSDGWSGGVLIRELVALYEAFHGGRPSGLAELPVQYADFAHWQRSWLSGDTLEAHLAYWRRQLPARPPTLRLPVDRPASAATSYRGAKETVALSPAVSEGLLALGRRHEATPFMTLLLLYGTLLHRYSGERDVLVGTPIANRTRTIIEGLIGFFVNTLPLRLRLRPDLTFPEALVSLRTTTLEAHAHQDLPFERLVEDLAPERSLKSHPLFRVMFSFQNSPLPELEAPGLTFRFLAPDTGASSFDLTFSVRETPEGFRGSLTYRTDLFDAGTVRRMAEHLATLAESVVEAPETPLGDLPLMSAAERRQLTGFNDTDRRPRPVDGLPLVPGAVVVAAERSPDAPAVEAEGVTWTYGGLLRRARRVAHRLRALGVGPDVPVGVVLDPSPERVAATLGIGLAGGAYLPLDPSHPVERLTALLDDADAPVVIAARAAGEALGPVAGCTVLTADDTLFQHGPAEPRGVLSRLPLPESLAYVIYTSGSTGRPKGVEVSHQALAGLVAWHRQAFGVTAGDRASHLAGPAFDASVWEVWPYLTAGAALAVPPAEVRADADRLRRWLESSGVTIGFVPTPVVEMILGSGETFGGALRTVLTGGDRLGRRPAPGSGFELVNNYGPTENTVVATAGTVTPGDDPAPPTIGRPRAGTLVHLTDARLRRVPVGVVGEMQLGGDGVARGYRGDPRRTAEAFVPDPWSSAPGARLYRTGDLARWLPGGELDFVGRRDAQVQIRGVRVEPGEVEAALREHPAVAEAAVVTVGADTGNVRLAGFVTAAPGPVSGSPSGFPMDDLRAHLDRRLPAALVPATLEALPVLPLTTNGKVDRAALAGRVTGGGEAAVHEPPRGATEELLAALWAEVLEVEPATLGRRASFFEVGGHSLLATRMLSRVERRFEVELPLERVFRYPTLSAFATQVDAARRRDDEPELGALERPDPAPVSFGQRRLWFLDRLDAGGSVYNVPGALRAAGPLRPLLLRQVLAEIVRRHEVLRTTLPREAGAAEPVQRIAPEASRPAPLPLVDLSGLDAGRREAEARRLTTAEAARSFDLETGPLFRVCLLRLGSADHVLVANLHHAVSDGWSLKILFREIARLSEGFAGGRPSALPELPLQYADYAAWQRRWLDGGRRETELAYWRETLTGAPASLELPTDRPRPALQTFRGRTWSFALPATLTRDLSALGRRRKGTLFMVLLAAHQLLLHRLTGKTDLVVGTPVAGRPRPELEDLIGFFVNTLALRVPLDPSRGTGHLLETAREAALGAYGHQNLPFEQLVESLALPRDLASTPLFQVMLVLQNLQGDAPRMPGVALRPLDFERHAAKFDWTLTLSVEDGRLLGGWEYNADLFDATTVQRFGRLFERLLAALAEQDGTDPERPLRDLPVLSDGERHHLLREWNDTATGPPTAGGADPDGETGLDTLFFRQAARTPEAVAVEGPEGCLTYGELARRAEALARALRRRGVGPETPVGLCLRRTWRLVAAQLAVLRAGGAYLPLDPAYPRERRELMLEDAAAPWVLTEAALASQVSAPGVETLELDGDWRRWETDGSGQPLPGPLPAGRLAYLIYTSGSTGRPKGVAISHGSAVSLVRWAHRTFSAEDMARTLGVTSVCFDLSVFEIFAPLARGGTLVLADSALAIPELPAARTATLLNTVPSAMAELVRGGAVPASVRVVNLAGEPLPGGLVDAIYRTTGAREVWNLYGPSEDTTYSTAARIPRKPGREPSIGRPLADTRAHVLDDALRPVSLGCLGELLLGGRGLARGYHRRPALTAAAFVPDPVSGVPGARCYRTGDLARRRPDGELEFHGRADHQVKIRGHRIELGEIETLLGRRSGVREAAVVVQRLDTGDRLLAFFVPEDGAPVGPAELAGALRGCLPGYMVPARFEALDALPLSPNGKVDRRALARRGAEGPAERRRVEPRDDLERRLRDVWREVLGVEEMGVTDDFFELGGHSLLAIHLQSLVHRRLGREVPIAALFRAPTVETLATVLRGAAPPAAAGPVVLHDGGTGAPVFCVPGAGGHVFRLAPLARRLAAGGVDRPVLAFQAPGLDGEAEPLRRLEDLAEHHLEAARAVRPHGPYHLVGYSVGGLVAYEMARRLRRAGEEVALLALIDTRADAAGELGRLDGRELVAALAAEMGLDPEGLSKTDRAQRYLAVLEATLEAAAGYRPEGTFDGPVVVFKAADNRPEDPAHLGWRPHARGVTSHVLPGDHHTLLEIPRVDALTSRLLHHLTDPEENDARS